MLLQYIQRENIALEEWHSALDLFSQTIEKKKNYIEHLLYKCQFKEGTTTYNSCLAPDEYFESDVIKIQQGKFVNLKNI